MKKITALLLALIMCICLINLNNNSVNAEDEEPLKEQLLETSNTQQAVLTEASEPSNAVVIINNNNELIEFLISSSFTKAKLNKSITYNAGTDQQMKDGDVTLLCSKEIDLNGYNLTVDDSLSFRLKTGETNALKVSIINSGSNVSKIKATEHTLLAMIQTKMSDDVQGQQKITTKGPLTLEIDGGENGIIFDGSAHYENSTDLAGVSVGYHTTLGATYDNQALNILNIKNVIFRNFHPDYDEYGTVGIGVLNYGGVVTIEDSYFKNCTVGVAAGLISDGVISDTPSTTIKDSTFKNNYVAVGNGDVIDGELIKVYVAPEKITITDCDIVDNNYGLSYVGAEPTNDVVGDYTVNSPNATINNSIDFYAENIGSSLVYQLNDLDPDGSYVFAVPSNVPADDLGTLIAQTNNGILGDVSVVSVDKATDKTSDKDYMMVASGATSGQGIYKYYIKERTSGVGVIENNKVSVTKGSNVTLKYKLEEDVDDITLYMLIDPNLTSIYFDSESKDGYLYIKFTPTISGQYFIRRLETDDDTSTAYYTSSNKVKITLSDPVDPGKKDESCEKVIGPTWHWNNKKGICEDSGSVKTYSR